jgi:hypothetical protein
MLFSYLWGNYKIMSCLEPGRFAVKNAINACFYAAKKAAEWRVV